MLRRHVLLAVALAASVSAEDTWPVIVVGEWQGCSTFNVSDDATAQALVDGVEAAAGTAAAKKAAGCSTFCANSDFFYDRCIAPRALCALSLHGAAWGYVMSNSAAHEAAYPSGTRLVAGTYVVVIGEASAIGALVPKPYDEQLTEAGFVVVNLGQQAGGMHQYLDEWDALEPLLVNAAAVVVNIMAIRNAANEVCPYAECSPSQRTAAWRKGNAAEKDVMEEQSLDTTIAEHAEFLARIDASRRRVGTPPRKYLLWHCSCDPDLACPRDGDFPQWWTTPARVDRIKALAWDAFIDANYADAEGSRQWTTVPIDKCDSFDGKAAFYAGCARRDDAGDATTCTTSDFRKAAAEDGCTETCGQVEQYYYPTQEGHDNAAQVLMQPLQDALDAWTVKTYSGVA